MNAVAAEIRKLLTLPSLRWTAALTCAATLLLGWAAPASDPLRWTQAGFLVLGALAGTQEHQGGGQIRATLLAMPRRWRLAGAKALALVTVTVPLTLVAPAAAGYLTATTLTAAAVGTLLRRTLPAVTVLLAGYLVVARAARAVLPGAAPWLPDTAVDDPARGAAALAIWTAVLLTAAATAIRRRDA